MRRLAPLLVLAVAILAAAGLLAGSAWYGRADARQARLETIRVKAREAVGDVVRRFDGELDALLGREAARPFYLYQHYYAPPEALAAQFVFQTSPLASATEPLIDVWFEILPDGTLSLPADEPDGPMDAAGHRLVARDVLPELIARVHRAPPRASTAQAADFAQNAAAPPAVDTAAPVEPELPAPPRERQRPGERRQASNAAPGPEAESPAATAAPGGGATQEPGSAPASVPTPPESGGTSQAGGPSEAQQQRAAAQAQRGGEPQVSQMPRWAVEANVRANDIARQIEVANAGDVTTQQMLQNDFNLMRGLPQQAPPQQPAVQPAPPPPAPPPTTASADDGGADGPDGGGAAAAAAGVVAESDGGTGGAGGDGSATTPAPGAVERTTTGSDAGTGEGAAAGGEDAAGDARRVARPRDGGRRAATAAGAANGPADAVPTPVPSPVEGPTPTPVPSAVEGPIVARGPEPTTLDSRLTTVPPAGPDEVPVVYGAFEPFERPDGSRYYVRTVDIEGDVRVQGFRLSPGGLRATLGNVVLDVQRSHDAFDLVAGGASSGPGAGALAAAALEGVPDVPRIAAILRPGSPTLDAEDQEDRRVLLILGGLSAVIAVAVLLAILVLRRELELAQRRTDFLSAVSHELRAPVTTIRMYAEMLRDGWVDDEARRSEYESAIVSEGERLSRLVENVLAYSRRERGKPLAFRDADLAEKVREVAGVQRPVFEREKLALEVDGPDTLPWRFDPDAVTQILVNLLDNALKHSGNASERRVLVRLSGAPDAATVSVCDHGPGIAAGEQKKIFEAFYRVGSELTRETRGTGLGLALVRRLARAHGGEVSVASEPGKGATFTVLLGRPR
ncbi:MAG: hypothetical protein HY905_24290 [Deltaproteobacteria bacterium]|nr:hypothetical protein [Deltaproteobacteria bacterium]